VEHANQPGAPGGQPQEGASPWRAPEPAAAQQHAQQQHAPQPYAATQPYAPPAQTWQPTPPPQQPVPPWLAEPQGNPVAVWSWVVAVPCAVLGLVLGIVGLVRSRRRGGAGFTHAVVGTALSAVVLLVGAVGLSAGAAAGIAALAADPGTGPRTPDGTVASLSSSEQDFIDALYEETYQSFDDATLLDMAYGFCADMDAGSSPAQADAALVDRWSSEDLDLDAAYDVEWSATDTLCQQHAEEFQAWDPASTDSSDGSTTTTTTTTTA
jgi:hypothetical protein